LPQVDEPYDRTHGRLTAAFNQDKYCGPNSAIRDAYKFEFYFVRKNGADEIKADIFRDSKTGLFRQRFKGRQFFLWTAKRKAEQHKFQSSVQEIVERIQHGEESEWTCPRCAARLTLVDSPALFDLRCPVGCFDYNFHRDPQTKTFAHGHFFTRP